MKRSLLFLISSIAILSACTTLDDVMTPGAKQARARAEALKTFNTQVRGSIFYAQGGKYEGFHLVNPSAWVSMSPPIRNTIAAKVNAMKQGQKSIGRALIDTVCDHGKPKMSVFTNVTLIIPQVPEGVVVDVASKKREEFVQAQRTAMKYFFYRLSDKENDVDRLQINPDNDRNYQLKYEMLLAVPDKNIVKIFKAQRMATDPAASLADDQTALFQAMDGRLYIADTSALVQIKRDPDKSAPGIGAETCCSPLSYLDQPDELSVSAPGSTPITEMYSSLMRDIVKEGREWKPPAFFKITGIPIKTKDGDLYPLHAAWLDIPKYFKLTTFLMPKEIIEKYWSLNGSNGNCMGDESWGLDGQTCKPSPQNAVTGVDGIWKAYFERFTTVKEAATNDPQLLNFSLSLDLNLFCAYGHPISELIAH